MDKKAMNQVEYISAMLIFLFGVIVIMYFALTFNLVQHKDYLTSIENNLKKETEITYLKYYVNPVNDGECFIIPLGSLPGNIAGNINNLTIADSEGQEVNYGWDGSNLIVSQSTGPYSLMISPNSSSPSSVSCSQPPLTPNFSFEEKFNAIGFDKIEEFKSVYGSDYESLSQRIAENRDFTVEIENVTACPGFLGETISRYIPRNVEVTAGEFPAKLFLTPERICEVKVIIKTWKT